jgi:hypothetical protein
MDGLQTKMYTECYTMPQIGLLLKERLKVMPKQFMRVKNKINQWMEANAPRKWAISIMISSWLMVQWKSINLSDKVRLRILMEVHHLIFCLTQEENHGRCQWRKWCRTCWSGSIDYRCIWNLWCGSHHSSGKYFLWILATPEDRTKSASYRRRNQTTHRPYQS